ncbi:MAG TPA: MCE family protein [Actinomycetota bacterium]|nr:MCE family protein [Actinomycetota bacterium]
MTKLIRPLSTLVVSLLLAGGMSTFTVRDRSDDTYRITAYFEKAIGLFPNSDVDILGVPVGKVTEIEPDGPSVRVEMEIASEYKVPADAFAQIVPISVISDRYIQLEPVYRGGPVLEDGAVLDVDRTQIPAELDDVFKQLKKLLDAIEPGRDGEPGALGDLVVQLNRTLEDREEDLRGTIVNAAQLTGTLSETQRDISNLLINLDDVLGKLSTRAGSLGTLNRNFAQVMLALAQSRADLEGTVRNLGGLTQEVGDLVRDHRRRLGRDLELASRITDVVLENRASVEESLGWLPIVATGLRNAYNSPPQDAVDVRDNVKAKLTCEIVDMIPPGPARDAFDEFCRSLTQEPPDDRTEFQSEVDGARTLEETLNCDEGVKRVRRQIRRLIKIDLPNEIAEELTRQLTKHVRKLKEKCEELSKRVVRRLFKRLSDSDLLPSLQEQLREDLRRIRGVPSVAGGQVIVPPTQPPSLGARIGSWWSGFLGFLGWSS